MKTYFVIAEDIDDVFDEERVFHHTLEDAKETFEKYCEMDAIDERAKIFMIIVSEVTE
jgi:hypothetical protein